jgi:hypothetical protein
MGSCADELPRVIPNEVRDLTKSVIARFLAALGMTATGESGDSNSPTR